MLLGGVTDTNDGVTFADVAIRPGKPNSAMSSFVSGIIREPLRIVLTWPGAFDVTRALSLGFDVDRDIDSIVRQFMTR